MPILICVNVESAKRLYMPHFCACTDFSKNNADVLPRPTLKSKRSPQHYFAHANRPKFHKLDGNSDLSFNIYNIIISYNWLIYIYIYVISSSNVVNKVLQLNSVWCRKTAIYMIDCRKKWWHVMGYWPPNKSTPSPNW